MLLFTQLLWNHAQLKNTLQGANNKRYKRIDYMIIDVYLYD